MTRRQVRDIAVLGVQAPTPRITLAATIGAALVLALPVFVILTLIDWLLL